MPVSLPLSAGMTLPTALAAPVADGMMLVAAVRPPRQSYKRNITIKIHSKKMFNISVYRE